MNHTIKLVVSNLDLSYSLDLDGEEASLFCVERIEVDALVAAFRKEVERLVLADKLADAIDVDDVVPDEADCGSGAEEAWDSERAASDV